MSAARMHEDELHSDEALVRRLLAAQFPEWAGLPVRRVASAGTDNAIYRVGPEMAARLPLRPRNADQVEKEHTWLPHLAPLLPLEVPLPLAVGEPGEGFPERWCLHRWLDGRPIDPDRDDLDDAARSLAGFIRALRAVHLEGGPAPGPHNFGRGVPLARRDEATRAALEASRGLVDEEDLAALAATWGEALAAPAWDRPPRWIHGDLMPGNLLVRDGRLTGVIDFGGLGVGDPACDLMVAWHLLDARSRQVFRDEVDVDDASWERGRGWALSQAIMALPYYVQTNPAMAAQARRTLAAVTEDR